MKASEGIQVVARNRRAFHDFMIFDRVEAGIELKGTEVKSLRQKNVSLAESFARARDGELYLLGMHIKPYEQGSIYNHDPLRPRKLLMHKREITRIVGKIAQRGFSLIPLSIYFNRRGIAKVELALARGKPKKDRREEIKRRTAEREAQRALKGFRS